MSPLLAQLAFALPLEMTLSPGASLEVLPPAVPGRADVVVHDNHVDLGAQVGWTVGTGISRARVWELGGDQLVVLSLDDQSSAVIATRTDGGVLLSVVGLQAPLAPLSAGRSAAEALRGELDDAPCAAASLALAPLSGADGRWSLEAVARAPALPEWAAAEPPIVRWSELWDTRRSLARAHTVVVRERLTYRLAALYRSLGQEREAAYYFDQAASQGGGHAALAHFQAAHARLAVRDWEAGRKSARAALRAGGSPEMVLSALLWAELQEEGPDALGMGRALASAGLPVEHERLAGVALNRGECASEAVALFSRSRRRATGREAAFTQLLLADSQLLSGDLDAARRSYAAVPSAELSPPLRRLLRTRTRHLALLELPVSRWASLLPELERGAREPGEAGLENLHLLAQVEAKLGLDRDSVESWAQLVGRADRLAKGPVGAALAASWATRSERLFAAGRAMDALALHRAVPRAALLRHLSNTAPLHSIAGAYAEAGLRERALSVWGDSAELERRLGLDSAPAVLEMARLFVQAGRHADALDAISWLRRHRSGASSGELALLEADAQLAAGRSDEARRLLRGLVASPKEGAAARLRLSLLDASTSRCVEALPSLQAAAAAVRDGVEGLRVQEALVRCQVAVGTPATAAEAARTAAGLAGHEDVRAFTGARAARLERGASAVKPSLLAESAAADPGIWGALAREEAAQAAFGAALARRRLP